MSTSPTPTTRSTRRPAVRLAAVTLGMLSVITGGVSIASATDSSNSAASTLEVDIAEDGTRFIIDDAPVFDDGFPAYGNAFVTQGYIYPAGTLTDSNGV